ncbi:PucR family transcriptional regulator [Streptomyces sp. NPDC057580]|uniref:PucR family transcriptional regulator n=1 Tax=Streptomyces sp. NPDC057580 TaxID=3346173 RepID=UPI0036AF0E64
MPGLAARVIAFSAGQPDDDEVRLRTVLDLREPKDVGDLQRRQEMRARVRAAQRPVYLAGAAPNALPRVGMAVRAGNEPLGVIWAVVRESPDDRREQGMVEAAQVVALALLRARADADTVASARREQMLALLGGGVTARSTARPLGLDDRPCCVLALRPVPAPGSPEGDVPGGDAALQRAAAALARHLRALSLRAASAPCGSALYAVVPVRDEGTAGAREALRLIEGFLARSDGPEVWCAGAGPAVNDPASLPASRSAADGALRVLPHDRASDPGTLGPPRTAAFDDIQAEYLLLRVRDVAADERLTAAGPLRALRAYDAAHGSAMVATLRAWLDAFGDVGEAARAVRVHKNTFRYRLARLTEIAGVDLADPESRFSLALQLRVVP